MAVSRDKMFNAIENGAAWDAGVVFNRTNGIPIDKFSVFKTKEAADRYAASSPVSYPGQYIAVVPESGEVVGYIIRKDGTLKELGSQSITPGGGSVQIDDNTIKEDTNSGKIYVNVSHKVAENDNLPITSAAVYKEIGNVGAILESI